ncbi:DUF6093 family protein [Janibacter melonis]|uniref:DUF6093 family protein n=1 Tax=Janibacter melonis TaxID=262209 RepID=UPI00174ACEFF|nr:DUF6093 family protein [Janibacter melonis]
MPLPGTRVIHPCWSRHHQPVATGGMNARCTITDPDRSTPGEWDNEAGGYGPSTPFVVLPEHPDGKDGWPCRVQAIQSDQDTEQAGQDSTLRRYLVQLDDPALTTLPDIEEGHRIEITSAVNDAHLVGEHLTIVDVQHGSERFTRDVVAEHSQQPRPTT